MALTRKILDLPDIDKSGVEVFESCEVDESDAFEVEENTEHPDIDVSHFNRAAAMAAFIGKVLSRTPTC